MIWLLYILLDACGNFYLIVKKKTVPHYGKLFTIRGIAAIVYGSLILRVDACFETIGPWLGNVLLPFPFLFNLLLNTFRGLTADYVGAKSGLIEPFIFKHNLQRSYFFLTLAMFIAGLKYFV